MRTLFGNFSRQRRQARVPPADARRASVRRASVRQASVRQASVRQASVRPWGLEPLEARLLLDGDGFLAGADVHLSLSFAPDGTSVAGQASELEATFNAIAPTAVWQEAILDGFQTWAVLTNADIGVVDDGAQPFGSQGARQDDDRFGDIRIGAIAMSPEVGAVSVPVDELVSGTWMADVVFNTAFDYQSVEDILAVAMHEAGNVFGLIDNDDPLSPLFTGGSPSVRAPTANDVSALQNLHGMRVPDLNETSRSSAGSPALDNDSFGNATRLKLVEIPGGEEGTAPSIVYGDITTSSDVDFFEVKVPSAYTGPMTVALRTAGISLLQPTLSVYDNGQQLIQQLEATSVQGELLSIELPTLAAEGTYFFAVAGPGTGLRSIGGYALVTTYDGINQIDQPTIDTIAGGDFRFLDQDELAKFFDGDEDDFFNDDEHSDDELSVGVELETSPGFLDRTRYEMTASIADSIDVDFYKVEAPDAEGSPADVATVFVRSLKAPGLVPKVTLLDEDMQVVANRVLTNGGGEYAIQATGLEPSTTYFLRVEAANPGGLFDTGNYHLVAVFGNQATELDVLAAGTVANIDVLNVHTLHIARPQLFHLALRSAAAVTSVPTAVVAVVLDEMGQPAARFTAAPGETRTGAAVLLEPGTYTLKVRTLALDAASTPPIAYEILGAAISDPFVGDPSDPTENPFECTDPALTGIFCYPGDVESPNPFLWDEFVDSRNDPVIDVDPLDTLTDLFGDWWSWVWNQTGGNGPTFANPDHLTVAINDGSSPMTAALTAVNVLANDVDPEGDAIVAVRVSDVTEGTLVLHPDGTFEYMPNPGFRGSDTFTYRAFDFFQQSNTATVTIDVGDPLPGDYDGNGTVDPLDHSVWRANFGSTTELAADGNGDGVVDAADYAVWQDNLGAAWSVGGSATAQVVAYETPAVADVRSTVSSHATDRWTAPAQNIAAPNIAAPNVAAQNIAAPNVAGSPRLMVARALGRVFGPQRRVLAEPLAATSVDVAFRDFGAVAHRDFTNRVSLL